MSYHPSNDGDNILKDEESNNNNNDEVNSNYDVDYMDEFIDESLYDCNTGNLYSGPAEDDIA